MKRMNKHNALLSKLTFWGSCGGFLFSLLLLLVTACSDLENEVDEMQQQLQEADLVELTIRTQVPGMKAGTRSIETDALTSIKVLAFDESKKLIKVVDATNVTSGTTGSFSVRVPSRTRIIHFIGNLPDDVTLPSEGGSEDDLKALITSGNMSYWGYASFNSVTELKAFKEQILTLYRNKAKISITAADGVTASIAGVANAYQYGVLIPHNDDSFNFDLNTYDYQTLPSNTTKISDQTGGTFTYVFEHLNDSKTNALNVICQVGDLYYKVVLAKKNGEEMEYYDIIRNHQYNIKINQVDKSLGKSSFDEAADESNDPINDVEVEEDKQVALLVTTSPSSTRSYDNTIYTVTVTTTENKLTDISTLTLSGLDSDMYELTGTPTGVTDSGNGTYTVTADQAVFTFTLEDGYIGEEVSNSITFAGEGTNVVVTSATGALDLSPFADMYEMYFDEGKLGGSTEYDKFFYDRNSINIQTTALTTEYVDAGANSSSLAHNHKAAAINMQSNSTITFTIADTRYLTLLVASNGNAPSIDLQKDDKAWTATSDEGQVPATYNFSKDGDITTNGRLIRYTLEPGTYTLQRGNNDYLLYYMRVTKDKPTMTDIVQPTAADYSLAWSGGTYANSEGKGYLMVSDAKHIVDQDNKTHTVALKTEDSNLITSLNLSTFTLSNIKLIVATDWYSFKSNDANDTQDHSETSTYTNLENSLTYNAGTYTLSSEIDAPNYKLAYFYDKLQLKSVEYKVKNPIMSRLYNSMDSGQQPVDEYTTTDAAWAIGFEMPIVMPTEKGTAIAFDIPGWTKYSSDGDVDVGAGLGVVTVDADSYSFAPQVDANNNNMEMVHPRPEWIYKIRWASIAAESIAPEITDDNSDVYFSYKGTIGKQVSIPTTLNVQALDIELDFYVGSSDGGSGQYTNSNLVFGETNLYLKVTIPENVAAGTRIELDLATGGTKGWINEWSSRNETLSDGVSYRYVEGITGLVITAQEGKRDYLMCWTFIRSDNNITDNVPITYELSSTLHKLSGETSANLTIAGNNKQIQVSAHGRAAAGKITIPLQYGTGTTEEFTVDVVVPDGVTEMTIEAADFDVSWSDGNGNVSNSLTYTFPTKGNLTHRFKFTLKEESKSVKTSNIYFSCGDKYVANGTVVVDLTERSADTDGGTTVWSGLAQLEWSVNYLSISNTIARGSTVRINFTTTGGAFKLHDGNGQAFKLGKEADNYPNDDSYLLVSSGTTYYEFEVNDITSGTDITDGLQGLKVNGNGLTVISIVVYEGGTSDENEIFNYNFDSKPNNLFGNGGNCEAQDGSLVFTATSVGAEDYSNQIVVSGISFEQNAVYTLTFKVKSNVTDSSENGLSIGFDNPNDSHNWCGTFANNGTNLKLVQSDSFTNVTLTTTATATVTNGRLFFNLGHLGACTIYIDDLKLVKND